MDNRLFNIISAACAAMIAIGSISIYECGSNDEIGLQSPSLIGPNAVSFDDGYADQEVQETGVVPLSLGNPSVNINDYTFVAETSFKDVKVDFGNDPNDPVSYDGAKNWLKTDTVLVNVTSENGDKAEDKEVKLKIGDSVIRISYNKEWSLVKLADGTQGYLKNEQLSDKEITPVPTATPTKKPTKKPTAKPTKKPTKKPTAKPTTKSSSSGSVKETAVTKTVYSTCTLNTRSGPGISYSIISTVATGTKISVVAQTDNGWYKSNKGFYVKASLTSATAPSSNPKATPTPTPKASSGKVGDKSGDFAKFVKSFIGCKYVAGGASPTKGFDCSGFVMYCYKTYYNITLPHGATMQSKKGKEVAKADIQVGDIICFDRNGDGTMEHSALYVGNDTYVHAKGAKYGVVADKFSSAKGIAHIRRVR